MKQKSSDISEITVYLCEKPSQGKDIAAVLGCHQQGKGYLHQGNIVVTWCIGHLLEQAPPEFYCKNLKPWRMEVLPILPHVWQMQLKETARKQFDVIKSLLKKAHTVVIATDADREGEVIAREILEICQYRGKIQRLWLSALDETSIRKALADLREGTTTEALYQAGLGRQRADWLIGINMTMATSSLYGKYGEGVLSVGRVQTPTLKLVVERDNTIAHFIPQTYYELLAQFCTVQGESFYAQWQPPKSECDAEGRILNHALIYSFAEKIKDAPATVEQFTDQPQQQAAPLCLSLSQLQKLASGKWGFSAQQTLDIAQALYETHKAITYPRSDCSYLPTSQLSDAPLVLKNITTILPELDDIIRTCDTGFTAPVWNDKKITAHHALVPTANTKIDKTRMNEEEQKIYELVCRYYIAQFLGHYHYSQRTVTLLCRGEVFKASERTPLKPGWKLALSTVADKDEEKENQEVAAMSAIPLLTINETVNQISQRIVDKQTRPPAYFTEGTLIEAMKSISKTLPQEQYKKILKETAGIGTEATRAAILETLFKRNYLTKRGKQIRATERGQQLLQLLPQTVADPVLTALWEQQLDQVATGQLKLNAFLAEQEELLHKMLNALRHAAKTIAKDNPATAFYTCPQCERPLKQRRTKGDPPRIFWGCSGYPECKATAEDENGKPVLHPKEKPLHEKPSTGAYQAAKRRFSPPHPSASSTTYRSSYVKPAS